MDRPLNSIQDFLIDFTYYMGKRIRNSDKQSVYTYLLRKFETELGYKVSFDAAQAAVIKSGYCLIGDAERAETVFICPLDTSRKTYLPGYKLYPLNDKKRERTDFLAMAYDALLAIIIGLLINYLGGMLHMQTWLLIVITAVFLLGYTFLLNNRYTFSRSSACALVSYIAAHSQGRKYAFAFVDRCADSYVGLRLFLLKNREIFRKAHRIIYFDCLAHSDKLLYVCGKDNANSYPDQSGIFDECIVLDGDGEKTPVCFRENRRLIMITAADEKNGEYYVDNIKKASDRSMNVERLEKIAGLFI